MSLTDTRMLAEDARRLLDELDRDVPGAASASGECRPALDIIETAEATEVIVDVPGVTTASLRVAIRRNTVLIVGAKLPTASTADARFQLAERSYGRFARAVRIAGAFDTGRAKAFVANGLLRIILPRIEDRRGQLVFVDVENA